MKTSTDKEMTIITGLKKLNKIRVIESFSQLEQLTNLVELVVGASTNQWLRKRPWSRVNKWF